jgi:hypothetical protein
MTKLFEKYSIERLERMDALSTEMEFLGGFDAPLPEVNKQLVDFLVKDFLEYFNRWKQPEEILFHSPVSSACGCMGKSDPSDPGCPCQISVMRFHNRFKIAIAIKQMSA